MSKDPMSALDLIPVAGPAVGAVTGLIGMARWIFNVSNKADEAKKAIAVMAHQMAEEKIVYDKRLEKVEAASMDIRDLTAAVRHQGEMTTLQLKALTEKMAEHSDYTLRSLLEVRESQKSFQTEIRAAVTRSGRNARQET
jgi:hypothetical protein